MSSSRKDYNMCLYNSLASKARDSPQNIKKNIARGQRRKIGKLGDTIDLNNFVKKYPFNVIIIRRGDDNKPNFSQIHDYFKTSGQAKDTIVIMHSKNHFEPVNFISDDIMEVLKFLAEEFENRRLQTRFINNTYKLPMIQAMEKEDTSLDSVLAASLFEHEQYIQNQIWNDAELSQYLQ